MAVGALKGGIILVLRMGEFLSGRADLFHLLRVALGQDGVAGVAVVANDFLFAIGADVLSVVTAETTGPIFVADVVRVGSPTGFHFREKIVLINLLHGGDGGANAGVVRITIGESGGDLLHGLGFIGVGVAQDTDG